MTMPDDPTIARNREARRQISAQCGHDPDKLVAYYIEIQKQYQARLLQTADGLGSAEREAAATEMVEV